MDATSLLESTRERLKRHEGRYAEIADKYDGFSYSWLTKLAQGVMDDPKVSTLQCLIDALDDFEGVEKPRRIDSPEAVAAALGMEVVRGEAPQDPIPAPAEPDPDAARIAPAEEVA